MEIIGQLVDVFSRSIQCSKIEVHNGRIVNITPCTSAQGVSCPYIIPGFIDSHVHIESTLMLPENYARMAVGRGTVGCIADPHEIANVVGVPGVEYMMKNGEKVRFHFCWASSPCVPSTGFETSGATLSADDVEYLLRYPSVYGLGEMMNVPGVLYGDAQIAAKIRACLLAGKIVDGHCPGLSGEDLQRYIDAGVGTDHECTTLEEGREKISRGMRVIIREGSAACDFNQLWMLIGESPDMVMFGSDDKYPDELREGYIDDMVRRSVACGVDVFDVLRAACVNPVQYYRMPVGLLRVGDRADFLLVDSLEDFNILSTYVDGRCVWNSAEGVLDAMTFKYDRDNWLPNNFNARPLSVEDIRVGVPQGAENPHIKVIAAREGSLLTDILVEPARVEDGSVVSDTSRDILKIIVYNRYTRGAKPAVGFIRGAGVRRGAIGSTIAHDSHNIVVIGVRDEDIVKAANALVERKGGLVVYSGVPDTGGDTAAREELSSLSLPLAGLMSPLPGREVAAKLVELKRLAREIGCPWSAPYMTMAFMALPVIPALKITDRGLFDFASFNFTSLFV